MHKNDFIVFVCALGCLYSAGCAAEQAEMPQSLEYYGLKFVLVPQGSRMIGTNNSRAMPHERPACEFRLDYTLYMSTTEVPVWLYESVMRDERERYSEKDKLWLPASAGIEGTKEFCRKYQALLDEKTGGKWICRLPYEAEWEYAACYGRPADEDWWPVTRLHSDPGIYNLLDHEWMADNSKGHVHQIATRKPNPLGLYDMLGNESEWCEGYTTDSVETMLSAMRNQFDKTKLNKGVLKYYPCRGGSYYSNEDQCRPNMRDSSGGGLAYGIRLVLLPKLNK